MYHNYISKNVSEALPALLEELSDHHSEVGTRQGSRVQELTHVGVTLLHPRDRYITVPGRKANLAAQIAETMWVLSGRDDIAWLSNYLPRAADFSDDGVTWRGGYGPRLRNWEGVDQIQRLFELLKEDPITRRAVAVLYDPARDLPGTDNRAFKDIPCNNWLHFTSRLGALDLHVATRSNDIWWGWSGVNVFEWSALQEIMACMLGVETGSLHFSITSLHLYDQHWARADKLRARFAEDSVSWPPRSRALSAPRFDASTIHHTFWELDALLKDWMDAEELIRTGDQRAAEVVNDFPEPMLQSWLRVLQWWWSGDHIYLAPYRGTDLWDASIVAVQPKNEATGVRDAIDTLQNVTLRVLNPEALSKAIAQTPVRPQAEWVAAVVESNREVLKREAATPLFPREKWDAAVKPQWETLAELHAEKHAAYGDSWKRRGEMLGILANIARKVDRLTAGTATSDETLTDTASDLLIYSVKYRLWLMDHAGAPAPITGAWAPDLRKMEEPERVGVILKQVFKHASLLVFDPLSLEETFTVLETQVRAEDPLRWRTVDTLIRKAQFTLWQKGNAMRVWKGYEV